MNTISHLAAPSLALPDGYWLLTLLETIALVAMIVVALARAVGTRSLVPWLAGAALSGWAAFAIVLGARGVYHFARGQAVPFIGFGVAVPLAIALGPVFGWPALRDAVHAIPQASLVRIQALRTFGIVFVLTMVNGQLPPIFAIPAGIGDIIVGVLAINVAYVFDRAASVARPLGLSWNALGILDLVTAVTIAFFAATTPLRLIASAPSSDLMTVLPLVMVPAFAVPIFLVLHIVSLSRLLERKPSRPAVA